MRAPAHLVAGLFAVMLREIERNVDEGFEDLTGGWESRRDRLHTLVQAARIIAELLERRLDDGRVAAE